MIVCGRSKNELNIDKLARAGRGRVARLGWEPPMVNEG
jgi:hypothetical protein